MITIPNYIIKALSRVFFIGLLLVVISAQAQETEVQYLSGTGFGQTKTWRFRCSNGMNSGKWSKIEVPSQWELQGFGEYTFGRFYLKDGAKPSSETGLYICDFKAPLAWKNRQVELVFEGVMTDTEAFVNGLKAGDVHRGGFYAFSYDVSDLLKYGKKNELKVNVAKESADKSVNAAERRADWWLFGGIYRPVYLRIKPKMNISRVALSAEANGKLTTILYTKNLESGCKAAFTVTPVGGKQPVGQQIVSLFDVEKQEVSTQWKGIKTWDCEHPNLYDLKLELINKAGKTVHVHRERIGFRTVEFRPQDGFYVNGTKIILKGVNRHCFYPDGGRTTNKDISVNDVRLIKQMNMNAIRSHYSPDRHLLDVCDSLGVFYLDEFTGWHGHYSTEVGEKLLEEFIAHDVNHPCIFLWSNGNEGGWNKAFDSRFSELDPQHRHVVHPWADFNGVDTHHYPAYQTGTGRLANGYKVFMPTEFLHSQYDQGGGAGLEDFWANYNRNPMFAGGFIWSFSDEAVKRTDKNGELDSDGPNGPDGILGPHREKEGSFYTIREVWSPVQFSPMQITPSFNGEFYVSNKYLFSNLSECSMKYRVYAACSPLKATSEGSKVGMTLISEGTVALPNINPGETGRASMQMPERFFCGDVLEVEVFDRTGMSVCMRSWPIHLAKEYFASQYNKEIEKGISASAKIVEDDSFITISSAGVSVSFNKNSGNISKVVSNNNVLPFNNGPIPVGMKAEFKQISTRMEGTDAIATVKYIGALDSIQWRMKPNGLLSMCAIMLNRGNGGKYKGDFFDKQVFNLGLTFSFPEQSVKGMQWYGRGPYRVWKNRIPGTNYGVWQKEYNNTITGESFSQLIYPEFKGYHANMYWATIENEITPFTIYSETDGIYLCMFKPEYPKNRRKGENQMQEYPSGDISFLYDIQAMRSFKSISEHGPLSQPSTIRIKSGDDGLSLRLWFDFR